MSNMSSTSGTSSTVWTDEAIAVYESLESRRLLQLRSTVTQTIDFVRRERQNAYAVDPLVPNMDIGKASPYVEVVIEMVDGTYACLKISPWLDDRGDINKRDDHEVVPYGAVGVYSFCDRAIGSYIVQQQNLQYDMGMWREFRDNIERSNFLYPNIMRYVFFENAHGTGFSNVIDLLAQGVVAEPQGWAKFYVHLHDSPDTAWSHLKWLSYRQQESTDTGTDESNS